MCDVCVCMGSEGRGEDRRTCMNAWSVVHAFVHKCIHVYVLNSCGACVSFVICLYVYSVLPLCFKYYIE